MSLLLHGSPRSSPIHATQFRRRHGSRCVSYLSVKLQILESSLPKFYRTNHYRFERVCSRRLCIFIWRREPRTTSGKLGKKLVRKRTLVFSASSKTFTFMLRNYVISPLGHGLLFIGISLVSRFMYNTFVTLSYQRNCIRYKSRRVAGLTSNIYTPRFHKNANIWRVVHIFGANV